MIDKDKMIKKASRDNKQKNQSKITNTNTKTNMIISIDKEIVKAFEEVIYENTGGTNKAGTIKTLINKYIKSEGRILYGN